MTPRRPLAGSGKLILSIGGVIVRSSSLRRATAGPLSAADHHRVSRYAHTASDLLRRPMRDVVAEARTGQLPFSPTAPA